MKLADLSRTTHVPATTIKWYLRVGLLTRGTATAVNQAQYDNHHVRRLRLVRTLLEVGGLSVASAKDIVDAIDEPARTIHDVLGVALAALSAPRPSQPAPDMLAAVDGYFSYRGWQIRSDSPSRADLAALLSAIRGLEDPPDSAATGSALAGSARVPATDSAEAINRLLDPYADAADALARAEVAAAAPELSRDELVERVVAGTVLMERALAVLRRLAHEHHSARRYRPTAGDATAADAAAADAELG